MWPNLTRFLLALQHMPLCWHLCLQQPEYDSLSSPDSWDFKQSTRNISPTINQANIVDLHPASVYSIRMYSFNKIGRSEASKELTISTEEAGAWPGGASRPHQERISYSWGFGLLWLTAQKE